MHAAHSAGRAVRPERRRSPRRSLTPMLTDAWIRPLDDPADHARMSAPMRGHACDLGLEGVRIDLDAPLTTGTRVAIRLTPDAADRSVGAIARVVWSGDEDPVDPMPGRIGLRFERFSSEAEARTLLRLVRGPGRMGTGPVVDAAADSPPFDCSATAPIASIGAAGPAPARRAA